MSDQPGPREIVDSAIAQFSPAAIYVGFSGGNDSRAITHWMMTNVPGCEVFHINTGIGIERTREYVRNTCRIMKWPLHEIRAKEDCGQDYEVICKRFGFPGPDGHSMMYSRLKERAIRVLVRRAQRKRGDKVMLATGMRHDESIRRMRYAGREVNTVGSQLWVNPLYWMSQAERNQYNTASGIPENSVTAQLGMSGECLCGAFAHKGEKAVVRSICPETADRIDRLEQEVLAKGFTWGWEGRPPKGGFNKDQGSLFRPLCVGCEKSAIVQAEFSEDIA